jgi:hypothetical protein
MDVVAVVVVGAINKETSTITLAINKVLKDIDVNVSMVAVEKEPINVVLVTNNPTQFVIMQ